MNTNTRAVKIILTGMLLLVLLSTACFGEAMNNQIIPASTMLRGNDPFVGEWCEPNAGRARLTIESIDNGYKLSIYWSSSAFQHSEWYMTGAYDAETNSIICNDCRCLQVTYDDEVAHEEVMYTNGKARFILVDDEIHWDDEQENAGADIVFTYATGVYLGRYTVTNCNEYISLRSSPSTSAPALTTIPLGAEVEAYLYNDTFYECSYQGYDGYVLSAYLEYSDTYAEELTAEQLDYIKGALFVPRDIVVTNYDYDELDYEGRNGQKLASVNLYSNGIILAGATLGADTLIPENDVWEYSETRVSASDVKHQTVGAWSETDEAYLKGAFGIPWNVAAHCDVGEPYYWEGGECWLTSVGFYAGENCIADTTMEEFLAGAAIASNINSVSMERDIFTYSPD